MRGSDTTAGSLFSYVDPEKHIRPGHPLRIIREIVNAVLVTLSPEFDPLLVSWLHRQNRGYARKLTSSRWVRHRPRPLRKVSPAESFITLRSWKQRILPPNAGGRPSPGERNSNGEANRIDCVRTVHKAANVLDKMPKSVQPAAKSDLREVWAAPNRATAEAAVATFAEKYGAKYEKAVTCLVKDGDALLTFYDFPAEHWDHLRTSNPIKSVFATVRHQTVRTKGARSQGHRPAHGVQARDGSREDLAPAEGREPVAQGRPGCHIPQRRRGH